MSPCAMDPTPSGERAWLVLLFRTHETDVSGFAASLELLVQPAPSYVWELTYEISGSNLAPMMGGLELESCNNLGSRFPRLAQEPSKTLTLR